MASKIDLQVAALATGFTIGFGFLTCWEAIKQTRSNTNPLRSTYIYMVWGEIIANLIIAIIGWLFLDGILGPTVPVLFFILACWVFEIQLLMQIIINRISVVAESRKTISRMKWGTVVVITTINVAVFCIWIPSHTEPPLNDTIVAINNIWDRISKVLILIVDAGLNWYFLRTVKLRLVEQHGLKKYQPLVSFNVKLMIVSIAMDILLIGLMWLPNQVVYVQFHPVVYMVKLNIEMSMASLITRLARGQSNNDQNIGSYSLSYANQHSDHRSRQRSNDHGMDGLKSTHRTSIGADRPKRSMEDDMDDSGIYKKMDINITVESGPPSLSNKSGEDVQSLTRYAGHPK